MTVAMAPIDDRLGKALVEGAFISQEQLDTALQESERNNRKLSEVLTEQNILSPETIATVLSFQLNIPVVELRQYKVQPEAVQLVPEHVARERHVIPLSVENDSLRVATDNPEDIETLDLLTSLAGMKIRAVLPLHGGIQELIDANYKATAHLAEHLRATLPEKAEEMPLLKADVVARAPAVQAVDTILSQGIKERASDIHIVPREDSLDILYRIDGVLRQAVSLPVEIHDQLISRIKVLAGMDIAERRRPQDGQFSLQIAGRGIDFRVATAETHMGEMVVMRILDKTTTFFGLPELGFQPSTLERYLQLLSLPFGMILVSGPTGSGKTTSLYASIQRLTGTKRNIMTIEDPIEYQIQGINQLQVNRQAGITFAAGLRAIMRLDPDIILVGEIRDSETANTAIQAALTGHLVITTIHANNAAGAITRLAEMGVEPYLITSAVVGSLAQRLVRRICPHCKVVSHTGAEAILYQKETGETLDEFSAGRGCNSCSHTGFLGRVGVFEVLSMSDKIRTLINKGAISSEITQQAVSEGMITMHDDGMLKVKAGLTLPSEVTRSVFTFG
jgi:general secretion pathway protein E